MARRTPEGRSAAIRDFSTFAAGSPERTDPAPFVALRAFLESGYPGIHGVDGRIGVETYAELIGFLARLIENLSARP